MEVPTSVRASAAGEENDLVPCRAAVIEVHASSGQAADDEHGAGLVVVFAGGDDVPLLALAAVASGDLNGS